MSNQTMYTVLIRRTWTSVLQDYFDIKNINSKIIRMCTKRDHEVLEPYEKLFNRPLGRMDAIVISPLTGSQIKHITDTYYDNKELLAYQAKMNEEELKDHYENYGYTE